MSLERGDSEQPFGTFGKNAGTWPTKSHDNLLQSMIEDSSVIISKLAISLVDLKLLDLPITEESDKAQLTTVVVKEICGLSSEGSTDENLLFNFQSAFEGWNKALFDRVDGDARRALKTLLRQGGVFTGRNNGPIGQQLGTLMAMETLPEWDADEFKKMKFDPKSDAYQKQLQLQGSEHSTIDSTPKMERSIPVSSQGSALPPSQLRASIP